VSVRVGLLGGLEVRDAGDRDIAIPSGKQQALLALLAINAGRVVPTEQVVDALWGENAPPRVRNGLQALASKLRTALGAAELVVMRGGGYVLDLPPDAIDVHRYESLVAAGRAVAGADPERAVAVFVEADSLWRGDPLVDFAYEEFAQPTITRLTELRLAVIEERVELEVALGRVDDGIIDLEALVAAYPLRERLRGQLMVALYRAGRQADALRVFQDGRDVLVEELGLEPGPELRRLEAAILAQDPELDAPVPSRIRAAGPAVQRGTIPAALSPLIGRDDELRELTRVAADNRLVTLIGPGGVGKTRLALEVARAESSALADGGFLVELAAVGDPAAVGAAIASALDLPDAGRLAALIGDREFVMVLDNCEHVIEAAATFAEDLLRRCSKLRLIATSREALRVSGETVWPVSPLALADAEELFIARAEGAGASVDVSGDGRSLVADICARLDGLPLAIELAAARSRALPMQHIAARLSDRFRLLTGGSRTARPRQQTLHAVVDWSYDLLFDAEQRVFERLSVFPGGCDLATAEAVCADDALASDDIADVMQTLVDKSLVAARQAHVGIRYTQLQTLSQYGQEKLTARGDAQRVRDAMAAHFATRCAEGKAAFTGPTQGPWLMMMNEERDNVRAALEWAIATHDAETAMVIAGGASWLHWLAGTQTEGMRWLDDALACDGSPTEQTRALALTGRGMLRSIAGDIPSAEVDLQEAREIFGRWDDRDGLRFTLSFYAETARMSGRVEEARARRNEALGLYPEDRDDPFLVGVRAYSHAVLALLDNDLVEAERNYRTAAGGFRTSGRPVMLAITLGFLADLDERNARYHDAAEELEEAVELAETVGMRGFVGSLYSRLAWSLLEEGDIAGAELMIGRALEAGSRLRSSHILFLAHAGAALLHRLHGRNAAAAAAAAEALRIHDVEGPSRFRNRIDPDFEIAAVLAACSTVLAVIAVESGEVDRASALLERAGRLRTDVGAPVPKFQVTDLERARAALVSV
jgi:predicted ATPase/DNA-binding SARP family transcriptional activator